MSEIVPQMQMEPSLTEQIPVKEKPHFEKSSELSLAFKQIVDERSHDRQIPLDQQLTPSVYLNAALLEKKGVRIPPGTDLSGFMKIAKEHGLHIDVYAGGMAWDGDLLNPREVSDISGAQKGSNKTHQILKKLAAHLTFTDLSEEKISPEEKLEEKGKLPALDFMAAAGSGICITLDPIAGEKSFISSLRADATAKGAVYEELRQSGIKPESINWSNGGFKEFQIHRAACDAIAQDIKYAKEHNLLTDELITEGKYEELLAQVNHSKTVERKNIDRDTVFDSGIEAYHYLTIMKDMDIYLGGAPAGASELAAPSSLTHSTPILRELNYGLIQGLDKLVSLGGIIDKTHPFKGTKLSRLAEMGRGETVDPIIQKAIEWLLIQDIMRTAVGEMRIVTLADQSGRTVLSDRLKVAKSLQAMYGKDRAIAIESHDEKDEIVSLQGQDGEINTKVSGPSQHGELKRIGTLTKLRQIVSNKRQSRFNTEENAKERYVVVPDLETVSLNDRLIQIHSP